MAASYHINPSKYPLQELKKDLLNRDLIPSRKPLKDDLETNLQILEGKGIQTLGDLIDALKNKNKIREISSLSGISEKYLTLLRREANSYLPNPVPLDKFSGFGASEIQNLAAAGIKNSRHIFELAYKNPDLGSLPIDFGVSPETFSELVGLSDLSRAYGVGPVFARILYDAGVHSINEFRSYTPQQVIDLYESKTGKMADFSISDIKFSLNLVQALDIGKE
ncbi:MAG: hypothetical protein DRI65_06855 [Chloroflexota bacterium]|nr:MAG: hypothetical protein DRI65_06855 [Chloroflexota bacterium]HDD61296.1 DUF4332 domain-containing protein [Chloroflexota bacterium]